MVMLRYVVDEKNEKVILLPEKLKVGLSILGDLALENLSEEAAFALAHLVAGKNVVFYGAPGTGKTRIAKKLCERVCSGYGIETANSEWGNFDIIGGFMLDKDGHPDWQNGVLTKAAIKCTESLKNGKPYWLVLDELNRANLDLAFGKVLTLMDLDYRVDNFLCGKENTCVPLCFRILATMNTYDKALLFSLGYAFMRRFAFIHIPTLLTENQEIMPQAVAIPPQIPKYIDPLRKVVMDAAINQLSLSKDNDFALLFSDKIFPANDGRSLNEKITEKVTEANQKITSKGIAFLDVLLTVGTCATQNGVEIGQALVIDAAKFIISYYLVFSEDYKWDKLIDEAVVAYIVPQMEFFMPQLRKAEVFGDQDLKTKWDNICNCMKNFGLLKSYALLESAKARFRVI